MIRSINDFVETWKSESEVTLKVLSALADESLSEPKGMNTRTIGTLVNHIVETLVEMPHKLDLITEEKAEKCHSVKDILAVYKKYSDELIHAVTTRWNDSMLNEETNMYGENWKNGFSLNVLIVHQIHHRGQLTALMRVAGLKVPGVYGPAREEWAAWGMVAPE